MRAERIAARLLIDSHRLFGLGHGSFSELGILCCF